MQTNSPKILTQARLKQLFRYEPETGFFTSRVRRLPYGFGSIAGCVVESNGGYRKIVIDGTVYQAHRLAVFYMTGCWPKDEVLHKNKINDDNRWDNLLEASHQYISHNHSTMRVDNKSGVIGVRQNKSGNWVATIRINKKVKSLGTYPTIEQAHSAYLKAKAELIPVHPSLQVA